MRYAIVESITPEVLEDAPKGIKYMQPMPYDLIEGIRYVVACEGGMTEQETRQYLKDNRND